MKKSKKNANSNIIEVKSNAGESIVNEIEIESAVENTGECVNADGSEYIENSEIQEPVNDGVNIEKADGVVESVTDGESAEVQNNTTVETVEDGSNIENKDDEVKVNTVAKKERRAMGQSSIYPIYKKDKDGNKIVYRYGFCMVLNNATKDQHKKYGNKLRYLEVHKSYELCEDSLSKAVARKAEILENKLVKLGWYDVEKEQVENSVENIIE